jgi:hypothetical protein
MDAVFEGEDMVDSPEPVFAGDDTDVDLPGDGEGYGFDTTQLTDLIESNNQIMQRLQVGPDPLAMLEMRLKSTIMMFSGERGLFDVELQVQGWLAEGLVEAETEMNRQKLLEGVNNHPTNNIMPMPKIVQGDM